MDPPDVDALQAELREARVQLLRLRLDSPARQHLADALEALADLRHDRQRGVDRDLVDDLIRIVSKEVAYWRRIIGEDRLTEIPSAGRRTD